MLCMYFYKLLYLFPKCVDKVINIGYQVSDDGFSYRTADIRQYIGDTSLYRIIISK